MNLKARKVNTELPIWDRPLAADGSAAAAGSFFTAPEPPPSAESSRFLEFEAHALLTRLNRVKPFALQMTSVPAAAVSVEAQAAIEMMLSRGRRELRRRVGQFVQWLRSGPGTRAAAADAQRRFTILRLRFNAVLTQLDVFSDALVQRSEHDHGIWLGGLDVLAADALALPGIYEPPPVICYLDRGAGAAIRRARTRLPGGEANPVALIRVPRERMIGSGIASSLVHEVGHQAASLLDWVNSFRVELQQRAGSAPKERVAWQLWERWLSEIVADLWAISLIGITATNGLVAVVSLPRAFVFRVTPNDPHPFPWIRVKLGCALGQALFPDPQWQRLSNLWDEFYPTNWLHEPQLQLLAALQVTMPELVHRLLAHRPPALRGMTIPEAVYAADRRPQQLRRLWEEWRHEHPRMQTAPPTLAFAVIGQARADERITPAEESQLLGKLLTLWALRDAMGRTRSRIKDSTTLQPETL